MGFLVAQKVKNPPAMQETWVQSLGWEGPLEKGMPPHSSVLAWRIQWQRSLLSYSLWGLKELGMTECLTHTHTHTHTHTRYHSKVKNGKNGFSFVLLLLFFDIGNIVLKH